MKKIKPPCDKILPDAKKALKKKKVRLRSSGRKPKYVKEWFAEFFQGYDLLENMIFVRPYIQQYYDIDPRLLELLIYMAPKQYFTHKDYTEIPKPFQFRSVKYLMEREYVTVVTNGANIACNLYRISTKGMNIVRHYYELLSGERDLHVGGRNPWELKKNQTAINKKRLALSKKIMALGPPEKKKQLYL